MAADTAGGLVVASSGTVSGHRVWVLRRFGIDGTPDAGYGGGGSVTIDPPGRVVEFPTASGGLSVALTAMPDG